MNKLQKIAGPLKVSGGKVVPSGIMPGPMEGVMTPLLCKALESLGLLDFWITPFIRITTGVPKIKTFRRKVSQFTEAGLPTIVQLMGTDPEKLGESAAQIQKLNLLGVNMNFGCPSKRVVSHEGGGSQLRTPQLMNDILTSMKKATPNFSVSAKIRTGFDDIAQMEDAIPAACEAGIDFLIVHFRTVKEGYRKVDLGMERLARAVELASDIPVIGSGDIFTPHDAKRMQDISGCAGITVARGLLKNPFLIREIQEFFNTGEFTTTLSHKIIFFDTMIKLARETPEKYWIRPNFIELGKFLWGVDSVEFHHLKTMTKEDYFALGSIAEISP